MDKRYKRGSQWSGELRRLSQRELRRMQARMMSNLGISLDELGKAREVVITLDNKVIRLRDASILAMDTGAGRIYQVIGGEEVAEEAAEAPMGAAEAGYEPSPDDVALVAMQAGVGEEEARQALIEAGGDLAKAILSLKAGR